MGHAAFGAFLLYALGILIFYWLIRLAVRHGIADADRRRSSPTRRPTTAAGQPEQPQ